MEITDVRIRLSSKGGSRVKAFATITFDDAFVVRDMRIIEGRNGLFVAMPSRPLKDPCPKCGYRNPVRGKYCAGCGSELTVDASAETEDRSLHRDVAHPITQEMRDYIHNKIIEAYKLELETSGTPEEEKEPKAEEESSEEVPPVSEEEEKSEVEQIAPEEHTPDSEEPETPEVEQPEEEKAGEESEEIEEEKKQGEDSEETEEEEKD